MIMLSKNADVSKGLVLVFESFYVKKTTGLPSFIIMVYVKLILEGLVNMTPPVGWNRSLKSAGDNRGDFKNVKAFKIY